MCQAGPLKALLHHGVRFQVFFDFLANRASLVLSDLPFLPLTPIMLADVLEAGGAQKDLVTSGWNGGEW